MPPSSRAEPFVPTGFTPADFPDVEMAILPKGKANSRLSSTSATRAQEPVETGASSSSTAKQPVAAGGEPVSLFFEARAPEGAANYRST